MSQTPRQILINLVSESLWIENDYSDKTAQTYIEEMLRGGYVHPDDAKVLAMYRSTYLNLSEQGITRLINDTIRRAKTR